MKKLLLAALLSLGLTSTSCLGPNKAFNGLHEWNANFSSSRWSNAAVHTICWVIPLYEISLLADLLVFNTIEWWGGENPADE